jgi:hypothetical protein
MSSLPPSKRLAAPKKGRVTKQSETELDIAARYFVYALGRKGRDCWAGRRLGRSHCDGVEKSGAALIGPGFSRAILERGEGAGVTVR